MAGCHSDGGSAEATVTLRQANREAFPLQFFLLQKVADPQPASGGHRARQRNGRRFGRPKALDDGQCRKIAERYAAGTCRCPTRGDTPTAAAPSTGRIRKFSPG